MDDAATERLDPLESLRKIIYGEVGQGERVARPETPGMDPNRRRRRVCLPALPLVPGLERGSEQSGPKAPSPLGVIRRKLDQRQPRAGHRQDNSRAPTVRQLKVDRSGREQLGVRAALAVLERFEPAPGDRRSAVRGAGDRPALAPIMSMSPPRRTASLTASSKRGCAATA